MLPTIGTKLHVRSSRVVIDGIDVDTTVTIELDGSCPRVSAIGEAGPEATTIDVGDSLVVPAPLDLHLHGAGGNVVPPAGSVEAIDTALRRTSDEAEWSALDDLTPTYEWLATLPVPSDVPTDPVEHVAAAARAIASTPSTGCRGIRIEGLFLNPSRAGVWPPSTFCAPDVTLLEQLVAAAHDGGSKLQIIDVAPELSGALALIARAVELDVVVSIAHTDATWEQARAAADAGATLATHTWNAMRPLSHRDPGVVAAVLTDPRIVCELICDGVHLHPGTIELSTMAAGAGRWIPVSDASPFAGCEPGTYSWAGATVSHDGIALRDQHGNLAGSASLLDVAPQVLIAAGCRARDVALSIGAVPRRVLDPGRGTGLHVGDPVWITSLGRDMADVEPAT